MKPLNYKKIFTLTIIILLLSFNKVKVIITSEIIKHNIYKESSTVDINNTSFNDLELLNYDLSNNKIFLAGEAHSSVKSIDMNFYLIKYFVEKANVKYILLETSNAYAEYLNKYLNTGNINILNFLLEESINSPIYTEEYYEFLQQLYKYNSSLPNDKKLVMVGIDIAQFPKLSITHVKSLIPDNELPNELSEFYSLKFKLSLYNYREISGKMINELKENEDLAREYIEHNYDTLLLSLMNLSNTDDFSYRDRYIIENFIYQYERLEQGKWFGQFGGYHTNQNGKKDIYGYYPFATYLKNEYEPIKEKIITINYEYKNSEFFGFTSDDFTYKGLSEINQKFLNNIIKDNQETMIFKINSKNKILSSWVTLQPDEPITKSYQYLLTFTNSNIATEYKYRPYNLDWF